MLITFDKKKSLFSWTHINVYTAEKRSNTHIHIIRTEQKKRTVKTFHNTNVCI
jgi:hypothetical protein